MADQLEIWHMGQIWAENLSKSKLLPNVQQKELIIQNITKHKFKLMIIAHDKLIQAVGKTEGLFCKLPVSFHSLSGKLNQESKSTLLE